MFWYTSLLLPGSKKNATGTYIPSANVMMVYSCSKCFGHDFNLALQSFCVHRHVLELLLSDIKRNKWPSSNAAGLPLEVSVNFRSIVENWCWRRVGQKILPRATGRDNGRVI
ncbi:hypothetical protein RRG08_037082 [Elysia crispata]|uniref:Uncharacterized protein n=1 Tax=Elysia crispata TaxID=231223 RepID=A0AAE0ZX74_9GAST|nr:hypothetical protein RRG08_037082 [Elysia crispata]